MAGRLEQSLGEGKMQAAMAFRATGKSAGMQRHSVPGQSCWNGIGALLYLLARCFASFCRMVNTPVGVSRERSAAFD